MLRRIRDTRFGIGIKVSEMKVGSIVETVVNFEKERLEYGFTYPYRGDILTVSAITPHPNLENRKKGIVLLNFEELPNLIGLCDKQVNSRPNFIELLPPVDISELIESNNSCVNLVGAPAIPANLAISF